MSLTEKCCCAGGYRSANRNPLLLHVYDFIFALWTLPRYHTQTLASLYVCGSRFGTVGQRARDPFMQMEPLLSAKTLCLSAKFRLSCARLIKVQRRLVFANNDL